jgi:REP-associated tyrosine transposase
MSGSKFAGRRTRGGAATDYPLAVDLAQSAGRVEMPRLPRLPAPGGTVHVVGRCNNREFRFTTAEHFGSLLTHLGEMARTYEVTLYAYALMANHVHLLIQAPLAEPLARPLRWFFRETTRDWQHLQGQRGHFWERRYWSCLVEDDTYALAALRYLDRNPVRAGLVAEPTAYEWSSCAAYALGASNHLIQYHPSYLALSPYPKVRQRHYRALLAASEDQQADARDPRWTSERAIGSPAFMERVLPRRLGGRIGTPAKENQ